MLAVEGQLAHAGRVRPRFSYGLKLIEFYSTSKLWRTRHCTGTSFALSESSIIG